VVGVFWEGWRRLGREFIREIIFFPALMNASAEAYLSRQPWSPTIRFAGKPRSNEAPLNLENRLWLLILAFSCRDLADTAKRASGG